MSARRARPVERCTECKQPTGAAKDLIVRVLPESNLLSNSKMYRAVWHPHCWAMIEEQAAESRARYEEQRRADIFQLGRSLGWTDVQTQALLDKQAAEAEQ
jgi:hypothetical protein